jgi:hypothetical protein
LPLLQKLWPLVVTKHKQLPVAPHWYSAVNSQKFFSTVQVPWPEDGRHRFFLREHLPEQQPLGLAFGSQGSPFSRHCADAWCT